MTQNEINKLTDKQLHAHCQTCGADIRKLQKEFAGYLHEVALRSLYKRHGFYSLYEYAAKLAGMSHAVVDEIMAIHKKLEDKPILKDLIAEQGWTKLKIVASSATPENQGFWAEKVKEMSKIALETYVKELRKQGEGVNGQNGMLDGQKPAVGSNTESAGATNGQSSLFTSSADIDAFNPGISKPMEAGQKSTFAFKLDTDTETKLRIFKQGMEKKTKEPQDWNRVMNKLLEIAAEHDNCGKRAGKLLKSKNSGTADKELKKIKNSLPEVSGRYIPAKVKHYLVRRYKDKCAYPDCKQLAEIFHHTRRFALHQNHDPDFLKPLCKAHERLAHHGLIINEEGAPEKWRVGLEPVSCYADKQEIDASVNKFRRV